MDTIRPEYAVSEAGNMIPPPEHLFIIDLICYFWQTENFFLNHY